MIARAGRGFHAETAVRQGRALRKKGKMERVKGFEPSTPSMASWRSSAELHPLRRRDGKAEWCEGGDSNPYPAPAGLDPKSSAYANSATFAHAPLYYRKGCAGVNRLSTRRICLLCLMGREYTPGQPDAKAAAITTCWTCQIALPCYGPSQVARRPLCRHSRPRPQYRETHILQPYLRPRLPSTDHGRGASSAATRECCSLQIGPTITVRPGTWPRECSRPVPRDPPRPTPTAGKAARVTACPGR